MLRHWKHGFGNTLVLGVSRRTQQDARLTAIPVVVLSADRSVAQKAQSIAADVFLGKPVLLEDLLPIFERFAPMK